MKIIFFGTPDFAVYFLKALLNNKSHEVLAVVTKPDKPKGRGKKLLTSPVKEEALAANLPILQPTKAREAVDQLAAFSADLFIVVAYGQILPQRVLSLPKHGCINVHGSLLPQYRGAAPIQWSIINGDEKTGVSIMYMDKGMDTGDIILTKEIILNERETYGSLHDKMALVGVDALNEALELVSDGRAIRTKQDNELATCAPMITKETERIDWSKSSVEIDRLVRGLNPSPGAHTTFDGQVMKLWDVYPADFHKQGSPGEIIGEVKSQGLAVSTGDGVIIIAELQPQGGKRMKAVDYLRGHKMEAGSFFV